MLLEKPLLPLRRCRRGLQRNDRHIGGLPDCLEAVVAEVAADIEDHARGRQVRTDQLPARRAVSLAGIDSIWV